MKSWLMRGKGRRTVLALFLLAAALCLPAFGQTLGQIDGAVTDSSGAVVPAAAITVTNTSTNAVRNAVSNESGLYSVPGLVPGPYSVRIEKAGFRGMTRTLTVQVQQNARVDFALQVGQVSDSVEVSAMGQMLTTENATVGTVIEERRIMDLPLNGRNFFSLVALSPNVTYGFTAAAQASGRMGGSRSSLTIALSGSRSTWQNYTLDGVTNTDINFNTYILQPSVDSLQEFKVQTGVYPAEFGREAGQVNVSTKSGTNQYHGTLSEFLRNDKLDARDYDFSSASRSATNPSPGKTPYRQNQYGYTLGGPVRIPKVFNGKDRLFFMSNWEGYNSRRTTTSFGTVLTPEMRNGDFSSILPAFKLADPNSRAGTYPNITQSFFNNNQIPADRLSAGSKLLASRWMPMPNQPTAAGSLPFRNYQYSQSNPVDKNTITERIDFNENSSSQWFGRFSWNDESSLAVLPTMGLDDGETLYTKVSQWAVSNVRTLSPTKVNEARFGYNSLYNNITQQLAGKEDVNALLGTPVKVTDPNSWGIPNINFQTQNLTTFGNPTSSPFQINNKYFQFVDNFSWVIGKHSLRMGGEYRYNKFPQIGNEFPRGQFYFNNQFTNTITPTGPNSATQSGGYVGGDFMLGDMNNSLIAVSLVQADFRGSEWAAYIDDSYKVSPRLTLSLGFRWEVAQPLMDSLGKEPNVQINMPLPNIANVQDPSLHPVYVRTGSGDFYEGIAFRYAPYYSTKGAATPAGTLYPLQTVRDGRLGNRLINTNYHDFAPRIGIAWSPSDKWSVRAGFGIFYSMESKNSIFDFSRGMGGRTGALTPTTYGVPTFSYTNFIDTASLPVTLPIGLTWGGNPHLPDTSTMTFVLNVQRTLGKASTLEVGYSGGLHRHLQYLTNMNQGILSASLPVAQRLPYPEWGASGIQWVNADGMGSYHGLAGKFTQRFGSNLSTLLSYTWSKALDTASNIRGPSNDFSPQDARCPVGCEKGPSAFHVPQRFVASILYSLPFGKGQKFLTRGGIANQVVGGWQVSTITTLQSGGVVNSSAWDSGGTNFITNATRLNCISGVDPVLPNPSQTGWLNPAAFSNPVAGTFGNCGRNTMRGPWRGTQDISVVKLFRVTERRNVEFRTEMFNAPNHVILNNPNSSWGSGSSPTANATFGTITGAGNMRQIQFALKFNF